MVELCVEESRSSLLSAFVRCHDGIVHGEAAALERVLRSGGGIDGAPEHGVGHAESGFGKAADHFGSLACGASFIEKSPLATSILTTDGQLCALVLPKFKT